MENSNEVPFDDEPITAIVEKPESNPLVKIEKALHLLDVTIPDFEIKTEDDRATTNAMRGELKDVERQIKYYEEDAIDPLNNRLKRLKGSLEPYKDKVMDLINIIKKANQKWDTAKLLEEEAEKKKRKDALEKEKKEASKKIVELVKKGEEIPVEVMEVQQKTVGPTPSAKRKGEQGTDTLKLEWQWWIVLANGEEWNKKDSLPVSEIPAYSSYEAPLFGILPKLVNKNFKPDSGEANCGLPYYIKTGQRSKSTFR